MLNWIFDHFPVLLYFLLIYLTNFNIFFLYFTTIIIITMMILIIIIIVVLVAVVVVYVVNFITSLIILYLITILMITLASVMCHDETLSTLYFFVFLLSYPFLSSLSISFNFLLR